MKHTNLSRFIITAVCVVGGYSAVYGLLWVLIELGWYAH